MKQLSIFFMLVISIVVFGQDGGYNKKAVMKEIRGYSCHPEQYYQDKQKIQDQLKTYQQQIADLNAIVQSQQAQINQQAAEITSLTQQLEEAKAANARMASDNSARVVSNYNDVSSNRNGGVNGTTTYRVQVGLLKSGHSNKFNRLDRAVTTHFNGKYFVYDVTGFATADDAYAYSSELRRTGQVRDAFVTEYVDGERNLSYSYPVNQYSAPSSTNYYDDNTYVSPATPVTTPSTTTSYEIIPDNSSNTINIVTPSTSTNTGDDENSIAPASNDNGGMFIEE